MKRIVMFIMFSFLTITGGSMAGESNNDGYYNQRYNKRESFHSVFKVVGGGEKYAYNPNDSQNETIKRQEGVLFELTIKNVMNDVYAYVSIKNDGEKSIYTWKGDLYSFKNQLSGDFFNVISEKTRMDYLGIKVNFGSAPDYLEDYIEISPGAELREKIKLNGYYHFLPGQHFYDIGTVTIPFMRSPKVGKNYLTPDNFFLARSNRVILSVDGDKLNDKIIDYYTVR
ncbi:hypothetical protein RBA25_004355 [Cronobacter turicensis]|nr:hypothetical protein [Cronobacter turicensis]EKY3180218.1 hypothetical protein [Cronobacter turicensis]ELY2743045.1 hypothetical protein [Cronobacter turicensis]